MPISKPYHDLLEKFNFHFSVTNYYIEFDDCANYSKNLNVEDISISF